MEEGGEHSSSAPPGELPCRNRKAQRGFRWWELWQTTGNHTVGIWMVGPTQGEHQGPHQGALRPGCYQPTPFQAIQRAESITSKQLSMLTAPVQRCLSCPGVPPVRVFPTQMCTPCFQLAHTSMVFWAASQQFLFSHSFHFCSTAMHRGGPCSSTLFSFLLPSPLFSQVIYCHCSFP